MFDRSVRVRLDLVHGRAHARAALAAWTRDHAALQGPIWSAADHLVRLTGPAGDPALLAARFGTTGRDPFLWLAARASAPQIRRMTSALLLRLVTEEDLPAALIVARDDMVLMDVMTQLATTIPGSVLYPAPQNPIIPLRSAAMRRRIARAVGMPDIAALDLRSTDGAVIAPVMARLRHSRAG